VTNTLHITSASNPRLKRLRRLLRRRGRSPLFVVEGHRQLRCAVEAGAPVLEVYVARELFLGAADADLVKQAARNGADVVELSAGAFRSVFRSVRPDGVAALAERWPTGLASVELGRSPLVLVVQGIERPGNLGTIVRSACAAGARAVVIADGAADPFQPDVVRGSVGTLFHVPLLEASTDEVVRWLRRYSVTVVVATPAAKDPYWSVDYTGPTALVVGSERHGLSASWLQQSDEAVSIPMPGRADSLNAAVAAGVVLFEASRQRQVMTQGHMLAPRRVAPTVW
jgi:TrmH family RNA methyltransferase